jgi:hypothetical protein
MHLYVIEFLLWPGGARGPVPDANACFRPTTDLGDRRLCGNESRLQTHQSGSCKTLLQHLGRELNFTERNNVAAPWIWIHMQQDAFVAEGANRCIGLIGECVHRNDIYPPDLTGRDTKATIRVSVSGDFWLARPIAQSNHCIGYGHRTGELASRTRPDTPARIVKWYGKQPDNQNTATNTAVRCSFITPKLGDRHVGKQRRIHQFRFAPFVMSICFITESVACFSSGTRVFKATSIFPPSNVCAQ